MDTILKRILKKHHYVKWLLLVLALLLLWLLVKYFLMHRVAFDKGFQAEARMTINDSTRLDVDVSSTSTDRSIGLAKYDSLDQDQAMLFVFDKPGFYSFWMRNMKYPIDIIWLNADKKIVTIKENADPAKFPESYYPTTESLYVLETVAGFSQQHNLKEGQLLDWEEK